MGAQQTTETERSARTSTGASPSTGAGTSTAFALMPEADAYARMNGEQARETWAYTLGVQAAIWGMQWVKAAQLCRALSAPLPAGERPSPLDARPHGVNVWGHARALPTVEDAHLNGPSTELANTETVASHAVVDLKEGPVVVVHPDFGSRYFRTVLWELHGDVHRISQKQDGPRPPAYALALHDWKGAVPKGVRTIRVRSRYVAVSTHMAAGGEADLAAVAALQDGLRLVALRSWSKPGDKVDKVDKTDKGLDRGPAMRPLQRPDTRTRADLLFFEELCEALKDVKLRDDEAAFARQLDRIGVTLGEGFLSDKLDAPMVAGLSRAARDAESILEHGGRALATPQPGGTWLVGTPEATSLDDWLFRGTTGWRRVANDDSEELVAPLARADERGAALTGENAYALRFPTGQLPPARYWRITMYDEKGALVPNALGRVAIGNMAEKIQPSADGSLTIHIQRESPGKAKEATWLPAPAGAFYLVMRMYQPEQRMLRGEYIVPPVQRVAADS
jgi:hypothetical protein